MPKKLVPIYFGTVSFFRPLSTLLIQFKIVYGPFGQATCTVHLISTTHCLDLDLNGKRPGVTSDGNFSSYLIGT